MSEKTIIGISILIPAYNYKCVNLITGLQEQARKLKINYEIIVADDGSTDKDAVAENKRINSIPNCKYIIREENTGRAKIRNFLTSVSQYEWLLFMDCDMELPNGFFLKTYLDNRDADIVDGGISIGGNRNDLKNNIRYLYENSSAPKHTAEARANNPYKSFRTTNFMVRREIALLYPFDERFRYYGYEDVLFGKQLKKARISIKHIDNPMMLTDYESNQVFISKTEEAMRTLSTFRNDLRGYSQIITAAECLNNNHLSVLLKIWHKIMGKWERKKLTGSKPWLCLFNIYRLGYYLSITK